MKCPQCGLLQSRVVDTRPAEDGSLLRRRRLCDNCGFRFTTLERVVQAPLVVVKKDGRREEFSSAKVQSGVRKACNKRPIATEAISVLVDRVEAALRQEGGSEVHSDRIGELVMDALFGLDQVAFVRFASVYQRFEDVSRFAQLLQRMSSRARRSAGAHKS